MLPHNGRVHALHGEAHALRGKAQLRWGLGEIVVKGINKEDNLN